MSAPDADDFASVCGGWAPRPPRPPATATREMVSTSQPAATRAGLAMLERGGNAVDAAIAAAAALSVCEPMSTGIGGDAFAIVWRDGVPVGLDAAGPAAARADAQPVPEHGPRSVTVPGAVAGWAALSERFGRLGLDTCLAAAIDLATTGWAAGRVCAAAWRAAGELAPKELGRPPAPGERVVMPDLAGTLRAIADTGPAAFYTGPVAEAITSVTELAAGDLHGYAPRWVQTLSTRYHGVDVLELPSPTQGIAALEALALLDENPHPTVADQVWAVRLALEDALAHVRDGSNVAPLIGQPHLRSRRRASPAFVAEAPGGTVVLCAVDRDGCAVSMVQSLFGPFGAGIVAPGTGVVLQNRGDCFAVEGAVRAGRRPYHTLIPGMLAIAGKLLGPFGVMGGFIQAQAHVQLVCALVDQGLDPQDALDRPRFRLEGRELWIERGAWSERDETTFEELELEVRRLADPRPFGAGQVVLCRDRGLIGGADSRKDGIALGN